MIHAREARRTMGRELEKISAGILDQITGSIFEAANSGKSFTKVEYDPNSLEQEDINEIVKVLEEWGYDSTLEVKETIVFGISWKLK